MQRSFLVVFSIVAAMSLAGCGDNGGGKDNAQSDSSGSTNTQAPSTPSTGQSGDSTQAPAGN